MNIPYLACETYGFKTSFTMSRVVIITGGLINLIITITIFFLGSIKAGF